MHKFVEEELLKYEKTLGKKSKKIDKEGIMILMDIFVRQNHSGFSASYCINYLHRLFCDSTDTTLKWLEDSINKDEDGSQKHIVKDILEIYNKAMELKLCNREQILFLELLEFKPLTPLTGDESEWQEVTSNKKNGKEITLYQNNRCADVFKYVIMPGNLEIAYCNRDKTYSDDGGITGFSTGRFGKQQITFPYVVPSTPKKVYIYSTEDSGIGVDLILTDNETIKKLRRLKEFEHPKKKGGIK